MSKRRLSGGFALGINVDNDVDEIDVNDDTAELQAIEKEKAEQSRRKSLGITSPKAVRPGRKSLGGGRSAITEKAALDNTEVTALYSQCIQLSTANKITMQNTWNLKLIDYIDDVLKADEALGDDNETNFQKASCTLDASVKIYSYRVDSVHQNTYKILGGLNRSGGDDFEENDENEDGDGEELDEVVRKEGKEKKARRGGASTLETNVANLNGKALQGEFQVDPLFRKTSAAFDEAGARGMLLNNLPVVGQCSLVFDSSDAREQEETENASAGDSGLVDVSELRSMIGDFEQFKKMSICPLLNSFQDMIRRLQGGKSQSSATSLTSAPANAPLPGAAFAGLTAAFSQMQLNNGSSSSFADGAKLDADSMFGVADNEEEERAAAAERRLQQSIGRAGDGDDDVDFDVDFDVDDNRQEAPVEAAAPTGPRTFEMAMSLVGQGASDYSFFNPSVMRNWAGPDHWKFKSGKSAAASGDAARGRAAAKATTHKGDFFIDFSASLVAPEALLPKSRAATTLAAATIAAHASATQEGGNASVERHMLPEDLHFEATRLTALFLKPLLHLAPSRDGTLRGGWAATGESVATYDYNNACDASFVSHAAPEYDEADDDNNDGDAPIFGGGVDNDFDVDVAGANDAKQEQQDDDDGELKLVSAPRAISKIEIGYARAAKKVDVKALKKGMWEKVHDKSNTKQPLRSFQQTMNNLKDELPEDELPSVSVPFCFICLLHLCNEQDLGLVADPTGNLGDFQVVQNAKA